MKKFYILMAAGVMAMASSAKTEWTTQTLGTVSVDTLYHASVGPGTTQTQVKLSYTRSGKAATSTVTYLTTDLTDPYVTLKAAVANNNAYGKPQSISGMMKLNTSYQRHYFAGVNADFAGLEANQSIPCGALFVDGDYVTSAASLSNDVKSNYLVVDKDGVPTIAETIEYGGVAGNFGTVTYPSAAVDNTLRHNDKRWGDYLVAYNQFWGYDFPTEDPRWGYTHTNEWGNEAELIALGDKVYYGTEGEFFVNSLATKGNMKVPNNGIVLSANGAPRPNVDALTVGSTVKIKFPFKADGKEMSAREVVGGWHVVVKDGVVQQLPSKVPSDIGATIPRARTAIGYNADKTKFVMAVVEETSTAGTGGMKIVEFGDVMASLGCNTALNLDGGGSSNLQVENLGRIHTVQSNPTYERAVANGLFAVTNAPETQEVARIEFVDKALTIKPGRGYQPVIYAFNKYGVLISTGLQNYTLSAPEATFDSSNRKMIAPESGYFALTADYNGITTSIPVLVDADGSACSDPNTPVAFSGNEFVPMLEKPADWVDPDQPNLYVCGKFQDWKFTDPMVVRPIPNKNRVYEFTINTTDNDNPEATYFKMTTLDPRTNGGSSAFASADNAWHIENTGAAVQRDKAQILGNGCTLSLYPGNENNITSPWKGEWKFVVDLVNQTITATTETPAPQIDAPANIYIVGGIEGHEGDYTYTGLPLEEKNGVYSITDVALTGTFSFTTDNGTRYGAYIDGYEIVQEDYFYESNNDWAVAPGNYDIKFSVNTGLVTVSPHVFAVLKDVTPAGYDFNKYEPGTVWKFTHVPAELPDGTNTWTAPGFSIYSQENMDADGQVSSVHLPGVAPRLQTTEFGGTDNRMPAFTIQRYPDNDYIGNCLVFAQNFSPGHYRGGWPHTTVDGTHNLQLSFYPDATTVAGIDAEHPLRVRLVFQILYRGRHDQTRKDEITSIYASVSNAGSTWATSYNGVGDNETGAEFPINHREFYKWVDEGETIADIPENRELYTSVKGDTDYWDVKSDTDMTLIEQEAGLGIMNPERFMVYEFDVCNKGADSNAIGIHINMAGEVWATYIFKEIKFFNVVNGDELLGTKDTKDVKASRAAADNRVTTTTAAGSLLGTRNISYRYYTEDGVKEIQSEGTSTGIDNVVADEDAVEAPVEYYNLQGVRVMNPTSGLYIKRQGTKVTKVMVR